MIFRCGTRAAPGVWNFTLRNTGTPAQVDPALHPQDATAFLDGDIYRLSVSVAGKGWTAQLVNALAALKFGESRPVPVHVSAPAGSAAAAGITLKAQSESDPSKTATSVLQVTASQIRN